MLEKISLFQTAYALARHSGARQAAIAQNIANADTPGYVAHDIAPFSLKHGDQAASDMMIATRAGHLSGLREAAPLELIEARRRSINPNQNTVSLQEEMLYAVEAKRTHDRALAIYKSGLNILRTSLGGK